MSDFSQFYQNGGVFMHIISIGATVALTAVVLHSRARRLGADDPKYLRLADRVAGMGVAVGVLGALFGLFDMCAALSMIDPAEIGPVEIVQAAARGGAIAPIPIAWSLMVAVPIWIATTVHRTRRPALARRDATAAERG